LLIKQQAIQPVGILFGVGQQFPEGLSLIGLAGCFGDTEQSHNLAADPLGIVAQGVHLNVEGEALTLLLPATDPCQSDEPATTGFCHAEPHDFPAANDATPVILADYWLGSKV
jgi:hypothetical protein